MLAHPYRVAVWLYLGSARRRGRKRAPSDFGDSLDSAMCCRFRFRHIGHCDVASGAQRLASRRPHSDAVAVERAAGTAAISGRQPTPVSGWHPQPEAVTAGRSALVAASRLESLISGAGARFGSIAARRAASCRARPRLVRGRRRRGRSSVLSAALTRVVVARSTTAVESLSNEYVKNRR